MDARVADKSKSKPAQHPPLVIRRVDVIPVALPL
jgi:hypothetical protein